MVNKLVDNIKFLNEDDISVVLFGCCYVVVFIIVARFVCFFCELRIGLVLFI